MTSPCPLKQRVEDLVPTVHRDRLQTEPGPAGEAFEDLAVETAIALWTDAVELVRPLDHEDAQPARSPDRVQVREAVAREKGHAQHEGA